MDQLEAEIMEPEKNLHAAVPPALLEKAHAAARQEHISLDELVSDAMDGRLTGANSKKYWLSASVMRKRAA